MWSLVWSLSLLQTNRPWGSTPAAFTTTWPTSFSGISITRNLRLGGDGWEPWLCSIALVSKRGRWEHLLSDERDGIWEVGLEKTQHLLACRELLKFVKGHEECAGEGFVLLAGEEGQKKATESTWHSSSVPSLSPSNHSNPPVQCVQAPSHPVTHGGLAHTGGRQGGGRNGQHVIC